MLNGFGDFLLSGGVGFSGRSFLSLGGFGVGQLLRFLKCLLGGVGGGFGLGVITVEGFLGGFLSGSLGFFQSGLQGIRLSGFGSLRSFGGLFGQLLSLFGDCLLFGGSFQRGVGLAFLQGFLSGFRLVLLLEGFGALIGQGHCLSGFWASGGFGLSLLRLLDLFLSLFQGRHLFGLGLGQLLLSLFHGGLGLVDFFQLILSQLSQFLGGGLGGSPQLCGGLGQVGGGLFRVFGGFLGFGFRFRPGVLGGGG